MRQKKANPETVGKYIDFLNLLRNKQFEETNSLSSFIKSNNIDTAIKKALISCGIIEIKGKNYWRWKTAEPDKTMALEVLNFCLEYKKKDTSIAISGLDEEIKTYIREIRDQLISNSQNKSDASQGLKSGLLTKAFNQAEISPNNHLFSKVENDQNKKFELLKSIAGGWFAQSDFITPYQQVNDTILLATEDLFNKFFKK